MNSRQNVRIIPLEEKHWSAVKKIYEEGIATHQATFETEAPSWEKWNASHLLFARLIALQNDEAVGWAALSKVSDRCVYAGVAEGSIYIKENSRRKGIGKILLQHLIEESERNNIWTITAGVFAENNSSLALLEKFDFRKVGYREKIGMMNGVWRDTILLERRSKVIGV